MEYPVDVLQDIEISALSDKEFAVLLKRFPVLYDIKCSSLQRVALTLMKYGVINPELLDGSGLARCRQFAVENCDRSLRRRHRALTEALEKYDQLPKDDANARLKYCNEQLTDVELIGYLCRRDMHGKLGILARSGTMFRITFPDGIQILSVEEADLFEHYQDGLPVEVLQNIQITKLSKEELLEVASRFPGMRELPISMVSKALFATKFGCFPRTIMTPPANFRRLPAVAIAMPMREGTPYDPPKSFVQFVNDNFIRSYGLGHEPICRALISDPESSSADQAELRNITGCHSVANVKVFDDIDEFWFDDERSEFLPSMRLIGDLLYATPGEAPKGFTMDDIKAGVERRKNLTKKKEKSPIIGALDKCIDSLATVKGIASKMNV
jgi:hypothetical protein